jgi:hypothetical protein
MESHGWTMRGPLNTDNIRALDGTLAATITDATGYVNFQNDIEARDIDARRNLVVFNNLTVQGPLAQFIQSMSVGVDATIGQDLNVGRDVDITRDLTVGRNAAITTNLTTANMRITGGGPAAGKQLQAADALGNLEFGGLPSIPIGTIVLFESNTAITGYTLLTDQDDDVVYITKGTAAGGEAGGSSKVGGTWTQPTHIHGLGSITVPAHNHKWMDFVSKGTMYSWASNGVTQLNLRTAYGITGHTTNGFFVQATSCNANNPAGDFWTQNSGATTGDAGDTDAGGTVNTWRPKGRNFTRQQRSS